MKNFKWDKKYLYWGVTAFCVVVCSIAFFWVLNKWSGVSRIVGTILSALSPFIYGILIAYLLNKIVNIFEKHIFLKLTPKLFPKKPRTARKAARIFSILLTIIVALGVVIGLLVIVLPQIYHSVVELITQSQKYFDIAVTWIEEYLNGDALEPVAITWLNEAVDYIVNWLETVVLPQLSTVLTSITGGVVNIISGVVDFFIGLIISIYLLYNKETFCAQAKKLVISLLRPKAAATVIREMKFVNETFGDYIVGTLIDALIVGVLNYIFMLITGMPYAALISIIVGLTNLIPVFGPFIGAVPSALLILLESPMQCLVFIIFTLILQQLDGHVLKPRIHSSKTGLSGFWIMFAIIFFGRLFGLVGMILGVPVITILYSILRRLNNSRLERKLLPTDTRFYKAVDHIDPDSGEPVYKEGFEPPAESTAEGPSSEKAPDSPSEEKVGEDSKK
jgi:predicted PurR-regulated permease PerM